MDAKCRWHSDCLDGAVSVRESLGQTKVMQIHQGPAGGDTKPPGGNNPLSLLFSSSMCCTKALRLGIRLGDVSQPSILVTLILIIPNLISYLEPRQDRSVRNI